MKRRAAVLALLFIGLAGGALAQESKQIDEALVALRDGDARARSDAIDLLGHVQTAASRAEVTSALRAATHDEDPNLRALAISSLVRVDGSGALDDCLRLLVDPDRSVRIFAVNALWQTFPYPTPVPASCAPGIAAALDRCDGDLRRDLFNLLTCVRPLRASLPLLLERWRETASCPFPAVGEGHLELAQALRREALPERRQVLCEWLTQVLHELGPRGAAALPELVPLLEHDDPRQRRLAAEWLGGMGPAAAPGLVGLVALLEDEDADVREEARLALGALGAAGVPGVGALLRDAQRRRASSSWSAIYRIGAQSRAAGQTLWWVPLRRYWPWLTLTGVVLCAAWALMGWLLRRVGHDPNLRYAVGTILAGGPACTLGFLVLVWLGFDPWLEPFLPQPGLAVLPAWFSYALSATFLALLPGLWVFATFGRGSEEEVVPWDEDKGEGPRPLGSPPVP